MPSKQIMSAVAILVVALAAAPSATASRLVAGEWDFREVPPGMLVAPGTAFGSPALFAAQDRTTLKSVSLARGTALDVTAWRDLRPSEKVNRSESMLSTDRGFATGSPFGSDGGSSDFDPGGDDFRVSVWIRPTDASVFPRKKVSPRGISPNVVQKGLSSAAGGFWKVDLHMVAVGASYGWAPGCVLKSRDGKSAVANRGKKAFWLTPGVGTVLTCERTGGLLTLTSVGDDGSVRSSSARVPTGLVIENSSAVSVAQKPGTTDPRDAYDGLLTDLSIQRG